MSASLRFNADIGGPLTGYRNFPRYEVFLSVTRGQYTQVYRESFYLDRRADPNADNDIREGLGKALEELGRILQRDHKNPLVMRLEGPNGSEWHTEGEAT